MAEKVKIIGNDGAEHFVDAHTVDLFFDGRTGQPISDADWDEQKARLEQDNSALIPAHIREYEEYLTTTWGENADGVSGLVE